MLAFLESLGKAFGLANAESKSNLNFLRGFLVDLCFMKIVADKIQGY